MLDFSRHRHYNRVSEEQERKNLMSDSSSWLVSEQYTPRTRKGLSSLLVAILLAISSIIACTLELCIGRRSLAILTEVYKKCVEVL